MFSSERTTRRQFCKAVLVAGTLVASMPLGRVAAAPAAAPVTWTVMVGGQGGSEMKEGQNLPVWEFMRFYPDSITVNEGDTILFKLASMEPHTVTFVKPGDPVPQLLIPEGGNSQRIIFNPVAAFPAGGPTYDGSTYVNSGQMAMDPQSPQEFKLTFTKAGTYPYVCLFHQMMKGKVTVQPAGSTYPQTQAQIDAAVKAQMDADMTTGTNAGVYPGTVKSQQNANGTTTYSVAIGWGNGIMALMRFAPTDLKIKVGDTVTWTQMDVEAPHTVTLVSGGKEPDLVLTEPQQGGPPKLVLNPQVVAPSGGSVYSGQGYFNSGILFGTQDPTPGPRTYTLTFATPGTFEYICVLHDDMGMSGHIMVDQTPTTMPNTGEGGGADEQDRRNLDD